MRLKTFFLSSCSALLLAVAAHAATVDRVVLKVNDAADLSGNGLLDPYLTWVNSGGFNEGIANASDLVANGLDFKDSFVDSHWDQVLSVRVSMYSQGVERAWITFGPGTDRQDFFRRDNIVASSWDHPATGIAVTGNNFFSVAGDAAINRHWFVNRNYGGCNNDAGFMLVFDGSYRACSWEDTRTGVIGPNTRGLFYSAGPGFTNYHYNAPYRYEVADVFAVSVTLPGAQVPLPGTAILLGSALLAAGAATRIRRKAR